ncbi:unnamed protein product [Protopolystoma xenopodis]|uniref:K Homology domain-containing protein n=1 Tax=Protopolystoma xenopodis TaxID=117903 RepID=A0A3S5AIR7_9PLAT|nr:unnamed protein product [Protopolystoma xenopodis]
MLDSLSEEDISAVQLKILIPSNAAGGVIGKGGEAIATIQRETGTKVKMSKLYEFYPGESS